jgi:hypothetical protein
MQRILFVFLDGIGLGPAGPHNPFTKTEYTALCHLAGEASWTAPLPVVDRPTRVVRPLDATLGVEGLPQSGTGQAALFTGVNCASLVGRHFGPFPHSATHEVLAERNVFRRVAEAVRDDGTTAASPPGAAFANAYPPQFFEQARRRGRWTVTTRSCLEAGVAVRDADALRRGCAVPADLTGWAWREKLGLDVPVVSAAESGRHLAEIARSHRLTLFEYFLTDKLGHGRLDAEPEDLLGQLDAFFGALIDDLDPAADTLVVTSDHGNLEDLSSTVHTRNPVPLFVAGWAAPYFRSASSLLDVTPAIAAALRDAGPRSAPHP